MRRILIPLAIVLVALAVSCQNKATSSSASDNKATSIAQSSSLSPEQLGTLGAQIKKQPNDADRLLAEHGLNEQSFAAAVRKVSENPADARRYTTAYKSAS